MAYTSITTSQPTITGGGINTADNNTNPASVTCKNSYLINGQLRWASNLRSIVNMTSNFSIPDIVKGTAAWTVMIGPDPALWVADTVWDRTYSSSGTGVYHNDAGKAVTDLCINGEKYANTYYSGGQIGTQELGEGLRAMTVTKIFTIFGECESD